MAEHNVLTGASLHEPKGVAAALAGQIYVADGAASGNHRADQVALTVSLPDISAAQSVWVACPVAGTVTKIQSIIKNAITIADAAITTEINGTPISGGGLTIAFTGSAAGDVDSTTPSGANTVAVGDKLEIITDGGSTDVCVATITLLISRSA